MADVQIAIIDEQATEITLAVPGVQGPAGPGVPSGGTQNQLLVKQSGVDYDTAWSSDVDLPGTLDVTGDATFDQDVTVQGDLTVNGTTTTVNTETLVVEDKNIELGNVTTPTDVTADGGGLTLKGTTDKTISWVDATDSWTSSEHIDLASGRSYRINGSEVLSSTALGSAVQISSANIPNGTIVDADVNASAAIAGTKIDPDFGSQTIATTGNLNIDSGLLSVNASTNAIGFYSATPITQPSAIANITSTATSGSLPTPDGSVTIADATAPTVTELLEYCTEIEAKLETALNALRTLGLIAA